MNISNRSKYSLCQLLELFSIGKVATLLRKHGLLADGLEISSKSSVPLKDMPAPVREEILESSPSFIGNILGEFGMKHDSLRQNVEPRYRFDQHWQDLCRNLYLDGYHVEKIPESTWTDQYKFISIEPEIDGADSVEDDLTKEIRRSGLPNSDEICCMLAESAQEFCGEDFNACLSKARIALERIAVGMADSIKKEPSNRDMRWGHAIAFLRQSGSINKQEESCLTAVYSLISPGSHTPVGSDEMEFVRMGRNLSFIFCYFLIKRFNSDH